MMITKEGLLLSRAIVLGANGYIGRNFVYLAQKDYPQIELALYDLGDESVDGIKNYNRVDVTKREEVETIDFLCDYVFVMIGKTGSVIGFDDYDSFIDVNEKGLLNVLSVCKEQKSSAKIVFLSTRLVYKGKKGKLVEGDPKQFNTIYATNKFACEQYLKLYNKAFGIEYVVFRICVPYGTMVDGASSYGTVDFFVSTAKKGSDICFYGDGQMRRTVTYIGDLCRAIVKGTCCKECSNSVYNIGGEEYRLKDIAERVARKYGVGVRSVEWPELSRIIESGDTVFDSSRIDGLIGRENTVQFEDWINGAV